MRRILLVEDNMDSAESLGEVLEFWGYQVSISRDGKQALAQAEVIHPNVVLLDIGLPEMDGYEVARRLRREPYMEKAMLVALTGYNPDQQRNQEAGFDYYFTKPVDLDALEQLLKQ